MNLAHKNEIEDWIRAQRGSFDGVTCVAGWSLDEFSANARGRVLIAGPYPRDLPVDGGERQQWYAYVESTSEEMARSADSFDISNWSTAYKSWGAVESWIEAFVAAGNPDSPSMRRTRLRLIEKIVRVAIEEDNQKGNVEA